MITLEALGLGFAFGWLLQRAGLGRYERIANIYRFTDLTVLQFMLSALVVGAFGTRALASLGLSVAIPIPVTYVAGNLLGGALFGVGMALSGFCPGTIAAGAGEGRLDYLVPGGLGLVAGALLFGWLHPSFFPALSRVANVGPVTLADVLGVEPWLLVILFAEAVLLLFYAIERGASSPRARATGASPPPHAVLPRP